MNDKDKSLLRVQVTEILGFDPKHMCDDDWDTNWIIAGAMMEKCDEFSMGKISDGDWLATIIVSGYGESAKSEFLPRAIIEACCEALK